MLNPSLNEDPFPASEFGRWAGEYDEDVLQEGFPFTGYRQVLAEIARTAEAQPGMSVLDLGCGTGNLAEMFLPLGCELWGTDFSSEMIAAAKVKLPNVRWVLHDLRRPFPPALNRRFDRIVSAYVFHHFEMPERAAIVERLKIIRAT